MNSFACFLEILLEGEDIHKLLKAIREDIGIDVAWKDMRTGAVFCSGAPLFCERATTYPLKELMRLYAFQEVRLSCQLLGYLLLNTSPSSEKTKEENLVNSLAAIQLIYRQTILQEKMESEYRNNFVQDLLYNRIVHQEELINRARTFHWQLDGGVICLIIALSRKYIGKKDLATHDFWELSCVRIRAFFPQSIFSQEAHSIVFLLSYNPDANDLRHFHYRLREVLGALRKDIQDRYAVEIIAAVGDCRKSPLFAHKSYQEARQALMILESSPGKEKEKIVFWNQLGGLRLLATMANTDAATDFCRQTLAPIIQDHGKNGELLQTLLCIEENSGNLQKVAHILALHYNTVKYRAAKIWELLNIDPANSEERFNLSLALRIYRLQEHS
ncbi:MAG: helix-turn-helix domain-containing protein [Synergistaceae bacterium]|jgi:purine catabolism regulator|nr:helix-turn-helix domain-containing protein [Synergistaceae bacterium]